MAGTEGKVLEIIELKAKTRETKGKNAARKLRKSMAIPAIVYGEKKDPMMLSLDTAEFIRIIRKKGSSGLFFNLKIDGNPDKSVMLKQMQMDPFGLNHVHVDFHEVNMDEKVYVMVPVEATGISKGVEEGGMLQIIRRELEVVCKPSDMPESIVVDITDLEIGDAIHVEDIVLGDAIEIPHDVNFTVITIVAPTAEEKDVEEDEEDLLEEEETETASDEE